MSRRREFLQQAALAGLSGGAVCRGAGPPPALPATAQAAASLPAPVNPVSPLLNPALRNGPWTAFWIAPAGVLPQEPGVFHFRKTFSLQAKPERFVVNVSADNRYQLFVNGQRAAWGPARGDLYHWRFETVDLAPCLQAGINVLAVVVWNFGELAPLAQVTDRTGLIVQGNTVAERVADTGKTWKCLRNPAYRLIEYTTAQMRGYFVVGPGEEVDAAAYPWGWEQIDYDDSAWQPVRLLGVGYPYGVRQTSVRWQLVPRDVPAMEETGERLARARLVEGGEIPAEFPAQPAPFMVPPHRTVRLILDQNHLTTAYPELVVSGGKGATVALGYAESLYRPGARRGDKGNRHEVEGKEFLGYYDRFLPDGGAQRLFRPLWWRTYRYLEVRIETAAEPLRIEDLRGVSTGYPFRRRARLQAPFPRLQEILDVGWRTARLCAHETYMDCPYYEQLQYAGDTRIQALISYYMTGDGRLARAGIGHLNDSRTPEGATLSRAPSQLPQHIPSFSLWWIGMVHDYWMYQEDEAFVRSMLPGTRAVLEFFATLEKPNGSLGRIPWWAYMDWANSWKAGVPPSEPDGSSAPFDLQHILALEEAAEMEEALGRKTLAQDYRGKALRLRQMVQQLYWDAARGLYADTPRKADFSQQTNALAVLAGLVKGEVARRLIVRTLEDRSLTQCSYYFRHYLFGALNAAGEGDRYLAQLQDWMDMLDRGLTTWAERPEGADNPSRSDCHAWSASPNFELFRTVLGVDSGAPGFRKVLVRPFLGALEEAEGMIPHPRGEVEVKLSRKGEQLWAEVTLPHTVTGELIWKGVRRRLGEGVNRVTVSGA